MKKFTRKTTKLSGKYYFKSETDWYETNDPETIRKALFERNVISFKQRIELLNGWAKAILEKTGIPAVNKMWRTKTGEWIQKKPENYAGGCWICEYVEKELGYSLGSVPGLAAQIISLIENVSANGLSASTAFDLGALSERLLACMWEDGSRKNGGVSSGESRKAKLQERNQKIAQHAQKLIDDGRKSDCASILSDIYGLSDRQIRNILSNFGI